MIEFVVKVVGKRWKVVTQLEMVANMKTIHIVKVEQ